LTPLELIYEGKAKQLFRTENPAFIWVRYKDDATAFNGEKFETILGKGPLNNRITSVIFNQLHKANVPNHFVQVLSETEQLVKRVEIIPLEVVVRNLAAGSLAKRIGWEEGRKLPRPIVEFYYKDDALGDPLLTEEHIDLLGIASVADRDTLRAQALNVNDVLRELFQNASLTLVDFKLEFGRDAEGNLILADEISPDTCRLWDAHTQEKLDKDRFRRDLGGLIEAYQEVWNRLNGEAHA
jgi:phosphoribosylaminoimidazole-succinocarboxamide synthase